MGSIDEKLNGFEEEFDKGTLREETKERTREKNKIEEITRGKTRGKSRLAAVELTEELGDYSLNLPQLVASLTKKSKKEENYFAAEKQDPESDVEKVYGKSNGEVYGPTKEELYSGENIVSEIPEIEEVQELPEIEVKLVEEPVVVVGSQSHIDIALEKDNTGGLRESLKRYIGPLAERYGLVERYRSFRERLMTKRRREGLSSDTCYIDMKGKRK